ncbi:MAG TPA: ribonuclease P protein component [Dongiaceae bacterium]|nr:ribonuclease P protein component [Dongiaceae bacterium]
MRHAARRDAIASRRSEAGQGYPRAARLVRKADFDAVYRSGKRRSNSFFTVFLRPNGLPVCRFGFSIKRALGGAVVRNRMRRRLREAVRLHRQEISPGWDIVIHPKPSVAAASLPVLTAELRKLLPAAGPATAQP